MAEKKLHWTKTPEGKEKMRRAALKSHRTRKRNARLRKKRDQIEANAHGGKTHGNKRGRPQGSQRPSHSTEARGKGFQAQLNEERQVGIVFGRTWEIIEHRARSSGVSVATLAGRVGRLLQGTASGQVLGP